MTIVFTSKEQGIVDAYKTLVTFVENGGDPKLLENRYADYMKMLNAKIGSGLDHGFIFLNRFLTYDETVLLEDYTEFNDHLIFYVTSLVNNDAAGAKASHNWIVEKLDSDLFLKFERTFSFSPLTFNGTGNTDQSFAQTVAESAPIDASGEPIFVVVPVSTDENITDA